MIAEAPPIPEPTEAEYARWPFPFPARMADWNPTQRRWAAHWGWRARRRHGSPAGQAQARLGHILRTADAGTLRLLACDLAEAALPAHAAAYPDDLRVRVGVQVARRYALGHAGEAERRAARHLLYAVCDELAHALGDHAPPTAAAYAVGFCLLRPAGTALRDAAYWAAQAERYDRAYGLFGDEHTAWLLGLLESRVGGEGGCEGG